MIPEALNEYLVKQTFGAQGYVCVLVHFICGLIFTAFTAGWKERENGNFFCFVDKKSTATYKKLVDQACLTRYNKTYSPHLPLYGFVLLSIGLPVLISVIYSQTVCSRVSEIESIQETSNNGNESLNYGRRTVYVFYCYIIHLAARLLIGIVFTALQHTYFYSNGFDFEFICNYDSSLVLCEDGTALTKWSFGIAVTVSNSIVVFVILVEIIYLIHRWFPLFNCCLNSNWGCDTEFVTEYFLTKKYVPVESSLELTFIERINFYKQQILSDRHNFYIKLVIHTERAPHKFAKNRERHEIYDVYTEVPPDSIELKEVKDLFHPNRDTKGKSPRSILVIGRPGIGKTALTEKIRQDWAEASNQVNPDYLEKIVFLFQLRWFNKCSHKFTLKNFLQLGTELNSDKFARIYEEVIANPQVAIIVFDGLDELRTGSPTQLLDESRMISNDDNSIETSAGNLFLKLVLGDLIKGATVVVTSRPTAAEFYTRLEFDRSVEIIGFTPEKIEEYVSEFCEKENIIEYNAKIWEQIHSSPELLNLCYIPVNCRIVCVTLSGCLRDSESDDNVLPTTLTKLYKNALYYLEKYHERRNIETGPMAETTLKKLQKLAFDGIKSRDLLFNEESVHEEIRNSSLLNSIPKLRFQFATQFCFIHLTIQEFLAARHVIQTFTLDEIKTFLSDHLQRSEWHLVIQFLAGHLRTEEQYKHCLWMLLERFQLYGDHEIHLSYDEVFVMKCLREVDNEQIVQNVCETTALKDVVKVNDMFLRRGISIDWAAVTYVLKYMKNLKIISLKFHANIVDSVLKLVQSRCFKEVWLEGGKTEAGGMLTALMKSECTLKHKHAKLSKLSLRCSSRDDQQILCEFFKGGHARHLHELHLYGRFIIPTLEDSKLLNKENCPELTDLLICISPMDAFAEETLIDACCKLIFRIQLTKLLLNVRLHLTQANILSLCKAITNEGCKLTSLDLQDEAMDNESGKIIFEALRHQHGKLTSLTLFGGNLTDECIPYIREAMEDEHCCLEYLMLYKQKFTAQGRKLLHKIMQHPRCQSRGLGISC